MQFDLVSPERSVVSQPADSVELPGSDGDMTVMADHASLITTLRPGIIRARTGDAAVEFVITGGFVEVTADGTSVLAERVIPLAEANADTVGEIAAEESRIAESLEGARRDAADTRIACLNELAGRIS